jgi:hypothetical protein
MPQTHAQGVGSQSGQRGHCAHRGAGITLERQQSADEAHDEIKTEHPGYLGSQDTYYVGTIKGIGRIISRPSLIPRAKLHPAWVNAYNNDRSHQGKMCCGRTPMPTLREGCEPWEEKVSSLN